MVIDYDLSNLPIDQAELWICLQANSICSQIMAAQAERLGSSFVLAPPTVSVITQNHQTIFPTLNEGRA